MKLFGFGPGSWSPARPECIPLPKVGPLPGRGMVRPFHIAAGAAPEVRYPIPIPRGAWNVTQGLYLKRGATEFYGDLRMIGLPGYNNTL